MTININKHVQIGSFQADFTKRFPYLKPVFFYQSEIGTEGTWSGHVVLNDTANLADLSETVPKQSEIFTFSPNMLVSEFENSLQNRYGLTVRIFRKEKCNWKETLSTRGLDLEGQNELGVASCTEIEEFAF